MKKIAFLIPSKGDNWNNIEKSVLFKNTLTTFKPEINHSYLFYIGFNHDDTFYNREKIQNDFKRQFPKYIFHFVKYDKTVLKGHLTKMWNILYLKALQNSEHFIQYFYQCGDDIQFFTSGWLNKSIEILKKNNNIGIAGPKCDHVQLLTQLLVSRVHYAIFQCLFPEYIFNWGCDDWINFIYSPDYIFIQYNHECENNGGPPRYETKKYNIKKIKETVYQRAQDDKVKLDNFLREKHISRKSSLFIL